jgi:hypothetical protein
MLKRLYLFIRRILGHYRRLVKRAYRYGLELRPDIWVAEGPLHNEKSITFVKILCATRTNNRAYLLKQLLGTSYREHLVGKAWLWIHGQGGGVYKMLCIIRSNEA